MVFLAVTIAVIAPLQGGTIPSTVLLNSTLSKADPAFTQGSRSRMSASARRAGRYLHRVRDGDAHPLREPAEPGRLKIIIVATLLIYTRVRRERPEPRPLHDPLQPDPLLDRRDPRRGRGLLLHLPLSDLRLQRIHVYWWPLLAEVVLFGAEIFIIYTFWFAWDRIGERWHLALGFAYILDVFLQTLSIDMLAAGMLTPGVSTITYTEGGIFTIPVADALLLWFNQTLWELQFHRVGAAVGFVGFLVAALGVLHYRDRPSLEDRKQWDWVAAYGIAWGVLGLAVQAVLGYRYMLKSCRASRPRSR